MRRMMLTTLLAVTAAAHGAESAYWARFADGTESAAPRIDGWDVRNRPRLGRRSLFDPANPVRLLRNMHLGPTTGGPRVEFLNGDVLAGRVTSYGVSPVCPHLPAGLAVAIAPPLRAPSEHPQTVYVKPSQVRRIVFSEEPERPYRPGMIALTDGRMLHTQAVRWAEDGIRILTDKGIRAIPFNLLAQLDMPAAGGADAVIRALLADATAPCPAPPGMTGRLTFSDGTTATCRMGSLGAAGYWTRRESYIRVHPTWAIHGLQMPLSELAAMTCWSADEIPLSLLPAELVQSKSFTGFSWPWRRNRNVRGEPLTTGSVTADLGVGMHSYCAVAFVLPPGAVSFGSWVGLDRSVGAGGCARVAVYRDKVKGKPLWQSGFLRGGEEIHQVPPTGCAGAGRLVLVADFAHKGRPDGADPGDIRDHVNWLLPMVQLDPAQMELAARQRLWAPFGVAEWRPKSTPSDASIVRASWNGMAWRWEPILEIPPTGLTLRRRYRVDDASARLTTHAVGMHSQLELLLAADDKTLQARDLPRDPHERGRSQAWDLGGLQGRQVTLALTLHPRDRRTKLLQELQLDTGGMMPLPWPRPAKPTPIAAPRPTKPTVVAVAPTPGRPKPVIPRPRRPVPIRPTHPATTQPAGKANLVIEANATDYQIQIPSAAIRQDSQGQMTVRFLDVPAGRHHLRLTGQHTSLLCEVEIEAGGKVLVSADFTQQCVTVEYQGGGDRRLDIIPGRRGLTATIPLTWVPGGTFRMGSPRSEAGRGDDEGPVHQVTISRPFFLGTCEITRSQYAIFEREGGPKGRTNSAAGHAVSRRPVRTRRARSYPGLTQKQTTPAVTATWHDAVAFCDWLSAKSGRVVRLPSEAEWEYACRAGTSTVYQWGNNPLGAKGWANVADHSVRAKFRTWDVFDFSDGYIYLAPVGSLKPNAFGLHDMHGNVWEWCQDWYAEDYYARSPKTDPPGPRDGQLRVIRGGSWASGPRTCRSASRFPKDPYLRDYKIGFRILVEAASDR